jgi:hypothetical protein
MREHGGQCDDRAAGGQGERQAAPMRHDDDAGMRADRGAAERSRLHRESSRSAAANAKRGAATG